MSAVVRSEIRRSNEARSESINLSEASMRECDDLIWRFESHNMQIISAMSRTYMTMSTVGAESAPRVDSSSTYTCGDARGVMLFHYRKGRYAIHIYCVIIHLVGNSYVDT
jgi:hypothetical protein